MTRLDIVLCFLDLLLEDISSRLNLSLSQKSTSLFHKVIVPVGYFLIFSSFYLFLSFLFFLSFTLNLGKFCNKGRWRPVDRSVPYVDEYNRRGMYVDTTLLGYFRDRMAPGI